MDPVAIYAAAVGTVAFGWRLVEFVLTGQRLTVEARFEQIFIYTAAPWEAPADPIESCAFEVILRTGRQPLSVDGCRIVFRDHSEATIEAENPFAGESTWPVRIEAGASTSVRVRASREALPAAGTAFRAVATLGTGKEVVSTWRTLAPGTPPDPGARSRT